MDDKIEKKSKQCYFLAKNYVSDKMKNFEQLRDLLPFFSILYVFIILLNKEIKQQTNCY